MKASGQVVAVLAGRRPDPENAPQPVFPLSAAGAVLRRVAETFRSQSVDALVGSAACGADLLGLLAAQSVGIPFHIVLPFNVERFLRESVIDRPGDWEEPFRALIEHALQRQALTVLAGDHVPDPFILNNIAVMDEALARKPSRGLGVFVWDGEPNGPEDATADLRRRAIRAQFDIIDLSPLEVVG